mgnify:CR=1 FL=1
MILVSVNVKDNFADMLLDLNAQKNNSHAKSVNTEVNALCILPSTLKKITMFFSCN